MEMLRFEEAHAEWLRNCMVNELAGGQVAYAVCRIDDEYYYNVLSGVFFTADDAFRYVCARAQEHAGFAASYSAFLLLEDPEDWYQMGDERKDWWRADFVIMEYAGGQPPVRMYLFGKDSADAE